MLPETEARALDAIVDAAAERYRAVGRSALHFARGKLRLDPVFAALLRLGLLQQRRRIADLGCGQGVLFALILAAEARFAQREWPAGWPPPPRPAGLFGIDLRERAVRAARIALGDRARVVVGDLRVADIPDSDAIVILDVLHYIEEAEQERVLAACVAALDRRGVLLLRVADADAGARFWITRAADQAVTLARNRRWPNLRCRSLAAWIALLEGLGLSVQTAPMSTGTPFANVLLTARHRRN